MRTMVMKRKTEYVLQMGFWSDEMEARGEGPDVFFIHFVVHRERDAVELLREAVELLMDAWMDKYGEPGDPWEFDEDVQDLFWSCSARPA